MWTRVNRLSATMLIGMIAFIAMCFLATSIQAEVVEFGHLNAEILQSAENSGAGIVLTAIPMELYREDDEVTVAWQNGIEGRLKYSVSPGGGNPANYPHSSDNTGSGSLTFKPADVEMGVGLYYCLITSTDEASSSVEFRLMVESSVGVTMNSPVGEISSPAPVFSWQANPGVPFYLVIVSDQPFIIEENEAGEQVVMGANATWMAITPELSMQYGQPDPSGSFLRPAPPLLVGQTYNWIVLNDYDNSLSSSSDVTSTPKDFWLEQEEAIFPPQNMFPEQGDLLNVTNDPTITFQWSQVPDALSYHIYLSEYREVVGGSEGFYPVWDAITSDPLIDLEARYVLINAKYTWKVIAEDAEGNIAVSDTTSFQYDIPISTLDIKTFDKNTGQVLPYATVKLKPIDGSVDITPILMDNSGHFEKFIATGTYIITTEKARYETLVDTLVLTEDPYPAPELDAGDILYEAKLTPSPAQFYGTVVDSSAGDIPVSGALIEVTSADETVSASTLSDANGSFSIGVSGGEWQITVRNTGYSSLALSRIIQPGENIDLGSLKISENRFQMFGTTTDQNSAPLWGVAVGAENDEGTAYTCLTDSVGNYAIRVSPGMWTMTATKTGFVSPRPQRQEILGTNARVDFSLSSNANFVMGKVTDGRSPIADATVEAVPSIGNPICATTNSYGEYTLNISSGSYVITASKQGYTSPGGLNVTVGVTVTVGETKSGLDFVLVPDNCQIEGQVTSDGVTGVAGATITAGDKTISADNNGYYSIELLAGTFWLSASKLGYLSGDSQKLTLNPGETISGVDFLLVPNASVISGKVTSAGAPVVAATVKATGAAQTVVAQTNAEGAFSVSVPGGSYDLIASKKGFVPDTLRSISVNPGVTTTGKDFRLTQYIGYLQGTVTDGVIPLRKASVTIQDLGSQNLSYSTVTDISGSFVVAVFPEISYQISVSKESYSDAVVETDLIPIGGTAAVSVQLAALPSQIAGFVKDETGKPVWEAKVKATKNGVITSAVTNARGEFLLSLSAGTYLVEATKSGYLCLNPSEQTLLTGEKLRDMVITLKSNLSAVVGSVKDQTTGTGIEGVKIVATESATQTGGTFYSAADGSFTLSCLLSGTYTLILSKPGYVQNTVSNLALPGGITKTLQDVLLSPKESSIQGYVEGPSGTTVMAAAVATGEMSYVLTDEAGNYFLSHLSPGEYTIRTALTGYSSVPDSITVSISPGEKLSGVDFSLIKNIGFIKGRVYSASDTTVGLRGAVVTAEDTLGNSGSAATDANGRYSLENLADVGQLFSLKAKCPGYTTGTATVALGTEQANFALEPTRKVLTGSVKNKQGTTAGLPDQFKVKLSSEQIGTRETSAIIQNGYQFSFSDLSSEESYSVSADIMKKGYTPFPLSVNISQQETTFVELTVAVHNSRIIGNVGIPGATVTARGTDPTHSYSTLSQPDGNFAISNIYADTYQVTASRPTYVTATRSVTVGMGETKDLGTLLELRHIEITLTGTVVGLISDALVANAPVVAISGDGRSSGADTTDQNGAFTIEGLSPNMQYTVATTLPSEDYRNAQIEVVVDTTSRDLVTLNPIVHNSSISGTVFDQQETTPVPDAIVTLNDSLTVITDNTGFYSFDHLCQGDYEILAQKPGYWPSSPEQVSLRIYENIPLDLAVTVCESTISGTVAALGSPVRNAIVRLESFTNGSFVPQDTTDQVGAFAFSALPANVTYRIAALKKGYLTFQSGSIDISLGSQTESLILSPKPNTIYGTAYYASTNQPVERAVVKAKDTSGKTVTDTTDSFGDYELTLPSGLYAITAQKGNLASSPLSLSGGTSQLKVLRLAETASVNGRILYGEAAVPNAAVVVQNLETGEPLETKSGGDGNYHVRGLLPGAYQISVTAAGFAVLDSPQQYSVSLGDSLLADFQCVGISNTVSGVCSDLEGGPIEGAQILLVAGGDTISTDTAADGSFVFENVADGVYTLWAHASGYASKEVGQITLANNQPVSRSFALTSIGATIAGRVRNSKTSKSEGGVVVYLIGPTISSDTTGTDGKYLFADLVSGNYIIRAEKPLYTSQPDSFAVSLAAGSSLMGLDFLLTPDTAYAQISGIISHGLEPIRDALVVIQTPDLSFSRSTTTDQDGHYVFPDLVAPGSYRLEVRAAGFVPGTSELIQLTEAGAETEWNYSFPSARISLLFTSDGISPLADMKVRIKRNEVELTLTSDSNGRCSTSGNLRAGDYQITVLPPKTIIAPKSWTISLAKAEQRTEEIFLPLTHTPALSAGATESTQITALSAITDIDVWESFDLYVKGVGQPLYLPRPMESGAAGFTSSISPQHRSGQLGYYIKAKAPLRRFYSADQVDTTDASLTYSEEGAPHTVEITSKGVLAAVELEPKTSILSLDGEMILQAHGYDETGTVLDSLISRDGQVIWELFPTDPTQHGCQIEPLSQGSRQAILRAGQITSVVQVIAKIGLHDVVSVATATIELKQVSLERIELQGTIISTIAAGSSHRFMAIGVGKTAGGQTVNVYVKPSWAVEPAGAGTITDGLFQPSTSYVGPAKVIVSFEEIRKELPLSIYQRIAPNSSELRFSDTQGFTIAFPAASIKSRTSVSLNKLQPPTIKKYSPTYELHGQVYVIRFDVSSPLEPTASIEMELPLPGRVEAENASISYWDSKELDWIQMQTHALGRSSYAKSVHASASPSVSAIIPARILAKYAQYAVLSDSKPLKISDVSFMPNPFSPQIGDGLTISYWLSSDNASAPFVTIKIHNLTGALVRTLSEREPQNKGNQTVTWDGLTDSGRQARNGRYIVHIKATDAKKTDEMIESVVLMK